jgi:hypothetical protein
MFKAGDKVRWVRALNYPEYKNAVGLVVGIMPSDAPVEDFNVYDVEFPFGRFALYGTQLEADGTQPDEAR